MKNLKKILCLVLVVAMVASMFVANAAYTDQADIENEAAVAVLSELGVLEGSNGKFDPKGILTRAQGAKIISWLLLNEKADKQQAAGNPFDDVKAADWHAGYIAYCVSEGIAAGYGNGKFGPNDTLTVAQFAKMLLNALGYDSKVEGYTGANWAGPVGSKANELGLTEGTTALFTDKCTREVAAQMALNTLKSTMVKYDDAAISIEGNGLSITTGTKAEKEVVDTSVPNYISNVFAGVNAYETTLQFAEKYFENDLVVDQAPNGAFGRPGETIWYVKNNPVATTTNDDLLVKTFTNKVKVSELAAAIGTNATKALTRATNPLKLQVWVDGAPVAPTNATDPTYTGTISDIISNTYANVNEYVKHSGTDLTAKSTRTEVYMDKTTVYVVIINTYVATADYYDENTETLEFHVAVPGASDFDATVHNDEIPVADYAYQDFVLVTVDHGDLDYSGTAAKIASVEAAKTVSGTIDTYVTGSADLMSITVGGKDYGYSAMADTTLAGSPTALNPAKIGTGVTLVLDAQGNVITFAQAAETDNYVYVADMQSATVGSTLYGSDVTAVLYFTDGTREDVTVGKYYSSGAEVTPLPTGENKGWHTYSVGADGKYNLTLVASANDTLTTVSVVNNQVNVPAPMTVTNKTVFVVVDEKGEATVYTGYKAMGTVSDKNNGYLAVAAVSDYNDAKVAKYVFVGPKTTGADIEVSGTSTDKTTLVYVFNNTKTTSVDAEGNVYDTYVYALVNGVKENVKVANGVTLTAGLHYNIDVDAYGYVADTDYVTGDLTDEFVYQNNKVGARNSITYTDGVLSIEVTAGNYKNWAVADNCEIIMNKLNGTTFNAVSMTKMIAETEMDATVRFIGVLDADGKAIETLYVEY